MLLKVSKFFCECARAIDVWQLDVSMSFSSGILLQTFSKKSATVACHG